jgi:hypothetical protein
LIDDLDRRLVLAVMLRGYDGALAMALKSVAQCAMVSLEILQVTDNSTLGVVNGR